MKRLLCLIVLGVALGVAQAQANALTLFVPAESTLNAEETQTWSFNARDGEVLSFYAQPLASQLDPILTIINANGDPLMSNDDYAPDRPDALIEAFTAPSTATYQIVVSGYGQTLGAYRLAMLAGYSSILLSDNFASESLLQTLTPDPETPPQVTFENGVLRLRQDGIQKTGAIAHQVTDSTNFYAMLRVKSIAHRNGWQIGLLLRQTTPNTFYMLQLNNRGQWRFVLSNDGTETVLRDWGTHPAIIAEKADFRLGVLANGRGFDVFYDGQYVGTVSDATLQAQGKIGMSVTTANALNSTVVAEFDELMLTVPALVNNQRVPTKQLLLNTPNLIVRQLQRQSYIPYGGNMALELTESTAEFTSGGITRVAIARNTLFTNFAYSATVSLTASGGEGVIGCGLTARDTGNNYLLAFADNAGGHGLSAREGEAFTRNLFNTLAIPKTSYHLLMIANEERVDFFLDGLWVGALPHTPVEGGISNAVTNYDRLNTSCRFRDVWLWTWAS